MKLIGAGYGRTGTTSIQAALEELGFGPCYHMSEVIKHPEHAARWVLASTGENIDWKTFLQDYQSTVDWPGAAFYKDLMENFPDAKVLLSVREFESWYTSCLNTIYKITQTFPMVFTNRFIPRIGEVTQVSRIFWDGTAKGRFLDKEFMRELFNQHTQEVIQHVPPEKLLVYDVKQGWEPLCQFLGVPVPEGKPFPRLNDAAEFQKNIRRAQVGGWAMLGVAGLGAWSLLRWLRK